MVSREFSAHKLDSSENGLPIVRIVFDQSSVIRALVRISHEIIERHSDLSSIYLIGIPNGGVSIARFLASKIEEISKENVLVGVLDTTLYRDDLGTRDARPAIRRTEMPSVVDDKAAIIIDDVIHTGRTIRAAMDALMDFGRPRVVQVVGLIDRGHRELPIKIDYVGKNIPTARHDHVKARTVTDSEEWPIEFVLFSDSEIRQ